MPTRTASAPALYDIGLDLAELLPAPAFKRDELAIKVTGRFGIGCPGLDKTVRALEIAAV
ncbi:hypothetical protein [Nocardioides sp. NPDC047086]|uniref:hypothetical protein n=1 Tax=Nocardioides sp. NPDC047086 TaxID=3154810 RepID=UPI0033E795F3